MGEQSKIAKPESKIDVDPAGLWLCQLPGMTPALALQLIATFGSPDGVVRAPSRELRAAGLPSALVSHVVGGARAVAQIRAGLTGLNRLGITSLPLVSPHYPDRLKSLPQPPLVLYVQGAWPIAQPVCLLESSGEPEPAIADAWAVLRATVSQHVALAASYESSCESPRLLGVPWGVMRARQRLTHDQWGAVSSGATTLVSTVAPTTHGDAASAEATVDVLVALADAIVLLSAAGSERLTAAAHALGRPVFMLAPPRASLPSNVSRLWGASGARRLLRALGIHQGRGATAQQERLF